MKKDIVQPDSSCVDSFLKIIFMFLNIFTQVFSCTLPSLPKDIQSLMERTLH
jgi:hypothetical protein